MCLLSASTGRPGSCLPLQGRRKSDSGPGREARKDMGDKEGQGDALRWSAEGRGSGTASHRKPPTHFRWGKGDLGVTGGLPGLVALQ